MVQSAFSHSIFSNNDFEYKEEKQNIQLNFLMSRCEQRRGFIERILPKEPFFLHNLYEYIIPIKHFVKLITKLKLYKMLNQFPLNLLHII